MSYFCMCQLCSVQYTVYTVYYHFFIQITQVQKYAETAKDILLYVMRDLSDKVTYCPSFLSNYLPFLFLKPCINCDFIQSGGFYAAEDADSLPTADSKSKKEGAFCVWEQEEIKTLLSETVNTEVKTTLADIFIKHYGVEENGNVAASKVHIYLYFYKHCVLLRQC